MRAYFLYFAVFFAVCAASLAFAQDILVNEVGYEQNGPKRAVIQNTSDSKAYIMQGANQVHEINLSSQTTVSGWSGRNFKVADFSDFEPDFSDFEQNGTYTLRVGTKESQPFKIGKKILQTETGSFQISFFKGMRNTDDMDRNLPIRGSSQTHNIYGGWSDATGDRGKHLSHLSYANYFNPQQIPLVAWSLLHANELLPSVYAAAAREEAAWGADYLLRALSTAGYFYSSVFDDWNQKHDTREICAWSKQSGIRSNDYQAAMREGGGVSIAALARASKMGISGDSSSAQYIAGAKRAYAHLKANPTAYQDNGKENIIDDYTGLLAATELYNATGDQQYCTDAQERAESLISRQHTEGWFYTHKDAGTNARPFYHAADEGLPIVALVRYADVCSSANRQAIRDAINKNLRWYAKITYERPNPFEYAKMHEGAGAGGVEPGSVNLARNGTATASRSEGDYTADKAIDGNSTTRWSSYQSGAEDNDNQSITVDLSNTYKVNKVILKWEAAYGKDYKIQVSINGTSLSDVFDIKGNTNLNPTHAFAAPVDARYVKMLGTARGNPNGGYSLYEFEIYGEPSEQQPATPHNARFFMPHNNETLYWWQGENARIASLSAAFTMGAQQLADPNGKFWTDTLFGMATAQLDWILGKNPFGVTMMFGFGKNNYPTYNADDPISNIKGGICNGITAGIRDESDIQWMPNSGDDVFLQNLYNGDWPETWANWRYIEQWIPHNAWYLIAISSLSHRIDNPIVPDPIIAKTPVQIGIHISQRGGEIFMSSKKDVVWRVHNLQGKLLFSSNMREAKWSAGNFKGTVVVSAFNGSAAERKLFTVMGNY